MASTCQFSGRSWSASRGMAGSELRCQTKQRPRPELARRFRRAAQARADLLEAQPVVLMPDHGATVIVREGFQRTSQRRLALATRGPTARRHRAGKKLIPEATVGGGATRDLAIHA